MKSFSISLAAALGISIALVSSSVANADLVIRNASDQIVSGGGAIDLGETVAVDPRLIPIQISNTGPVALENVTCVFQGGAAADYSLVHSPPTTIPAMSSVSATVRFAPQALGQRSASLVISSDAPAPLQASVSLTGVGGTVFAPIVSAPSGSPIITQAWSGEYTFGVFTLGYRPTAAPIVISQIPSPNPGGFAVPSDGVVYGSYHGKLYTFNYIASVPGPPPTRIITYSLSLAMGDRSFNASLDGISGGGMSAIQSDGKITISGNFTSVRGEPRSRMARFRPDGSLVSEFRPSFDHLPTCLFIDREERTLVAGYFNKVNEIERPGLARLRPDGTLDDSFVPLFSGKAEKVVGLPDGKMMICGSFRSSGPDQRQYLARLNSDGSIDPAFDAGNDEGGDPVFAVGVQPDGKVLSGPVTKNGEIIQFARFNTDGSWDNSFQCEVDSTVSAVLVQNDGKILIGGHFGTVNGVPARCIARLEPDGSLDPEFSLHSFWSSSSGGPAVSCLAQQADGGVLIGGIFDVVSGYARSCGIARLHADGAFDEGFDPGGSSTRITGITLDRFGSIFVNGDFYALGGIRHRNFVKLNNHEGISVLNIVDSDSLVWSRGGTVPDVSSAEFEVSTDSGVNWSSVGQGYSVAGGWQIDGVSLPAHGFVRARGLQLVSNRGFGIVGEIKLFGRDLSPLEAWRQEKFSNPLNDADAANSFDADSDGVGNLIEYGFGLDPKNPSSNQAPAWNLAGNGYVVSFQKPAGTEGLIHGAEWSATMAPDDWHPAEDLSIGNQKSFRVPFDSRSKLFFRLKVIAP